MLLTVTSLSSLAEVARLRDVTAASRVSGRAHQRGRALGPAHLPLAALGPATFVRILFGGSIDRSMRADLPPGNEKIVRREPMNAAERLVEHGHHVDDEPDEHGEHTAKHEVGRPAEIEQPQDENVQNRPGQDDVPDDRRDARPGRLDAQTAPVDELANTPQRFAMQDVFAALTVGSEAQKLAVKVVNQQRPWRGGLVAPLLAPAGPCLLVHVAAQRVDQRSAGRLRVAVLSGLAPTRATGTRLTQDILEIFWRHTANSNNR